MLRAAVLLCVALASCGGQGVELKTVVVDGGPLALGDAGGGNATPTPYTDPFAGQPPFKSQQSGNSSHNAGKACLAGGCHAAGGDKAFLIGGTIYKDYAGSAPEVGAEIRVVDGNGHAVSTYSDSNGNFHIPAGTGNVSFPAVVGARNAQISRPMVTQLTGTMGNCAQGGCHGNGYYLIHIP